jgi:hypothetical protein
LFKQQVANLDFLASLAGVKHGARIVPRGIAGLPSITLLGVRAPTGLATIAAAGAVPAVPVMEGTWAADTRAIDLELRLSDDYADIPY